MAKITINGREIEAPDGAPLVEVIKNAGIFISNLCYIDGSPPYAGCRTCLVEIEGMRGLQLSCTAKVTEGMVVRTDTEEAKQGRQAVLSLIMSYHSDRCLTCHRVVKCKPGDTCLRDNTVTHRCLTCSKNYRCELQTTCEKLGMAGVRPPDVHHLHPLRPRLRRDQAYGRHHSGRPRAAHPHRVRRRRAHPRVQLRLLRLLYRRLPHSHSYGAP